MNNSPSYVPYLILAVICAAASVAIVFIAMVALARGGVTDSGMYAIAAMAFAPALLGTGIAAYMRDRR
jgi:hypothetical protein